MWNKLRQRFNDLTLAQRFMLASFVILVAGMVSIGAWVEAQIEEGVVHRTAATTALYVNSILSPDLQSMAQTDSLTPSDVNNLNVLLNESAFGQHIAVLKIWDTHGRIVYSTDPVLVGQSFPVQGGLAQAISGEVAARISDLEDEENVRERATQGRLLEVYSPVRLGGSAQIIAVVEFYYSVADLENDIAAAQWRTWLGVGGATVIMYFLLALFVRQASNTIARQRGELSAQVERLTKLLAQNKELDHRVRRAAARTTALNERFLRRVSAELHDGPAQDLGLALLRLDHVIGRYGACECTRPAGNVMAPADDLEVVQSSLRRAMQEIRGISSGLGLPQMESWTLPEIVSRVVSTHERRTGTTVEVNVECPAVQATLPVKLTLYRLIQEALTNAYRHADGQAQQVSLRCPDGDLIVEVRDRGPGFDLASVNGRDAHLGLSGMRERVESLGGHFEVESTPGQGTRILAHLALEARGDDER